LSSTEIYHTVSLIIAASIGSIVTVGFTLVLRKEYKKQEEDRKNSLMEEPRGEKKILTTKM